MNVNVRNVSGITGEILLNQQIYPQPVASSEAEAA